MHRSKELYDALSYLPPLEPATPLNHKTMEKTMSQADLSEQLNKLLLRNEDANLAILTEIQKNIKSSPYFPRPQFSNTDLSRHLYKSDTDPNWIKAQCQSINNQIEKIMTSQVHFLSTEFTRNLIHDIYIFAEKTNTIQCDNKIRKQNYLSSMDFFLRAKFSYAPNYTPITTSGEMFSFASSPTLIRQAIEIKIKNMIGIRSATNKSNNKPAQIKISELLEFLKKIPQHLTLPINIAILENINRWTNEFIHTGMLQYAWQKLEAIDLIEPMFAIEDAGGMHIEGFNYFKPEYSKSHLKNDIESHFSQRKKKIRFHLYDQPIEGRPAINVVDGQ